MILATLRDCLVIHLMTIANGDYDRVNVYADGANSG